MLAQAKAKALPGVELMQGSALDLSRFKTGTFDVVMMTQVLHHLEPETHVQALSEMTRVLKSGGALWMSTQTPHQHMGGFWWTPIIPKASAFVAARFSGLPELTAQLKAAGLKDVQSTSPAEPLVAHPNYLVVDGPFDEVFRKCDSTWAAATTEELKAGQDWWRSVIDAGDAEKFLEERENVRAMVGQSTAIMAFKA